MQNKRGVDAIVATVLIIMITVAAVAILWAFVIPMIKNSLDSSTSEKVSLTIENMGGYTTWDASQKVLRVQVKRGVDNANLTGIQFIITNSSGSLTNISESLGAGLAKVYTFYEIATKPNKVAIAPVTAKGVGEIVSETTLIGDYSGPAICNSWIYSSSWSDCNAGKKTRSIVLSLPINCQGGNPILTASCTLPTCSFIYNQVCVGSVLNRTSVNSSFPSGCEGTPTFGMTSLPCGSPVPGEEGDCVGMNSHCYSGYCDYEGHCSNGGVGVSCSDNTNCQTGLICLDNNCTYTSGSVGESCGVSSDCQTGLSCYHNKCSDGGLGSSCEYPGYYVMGDGGCISPLMCKSDNTCGGCRYTEDCTLTNPYCAIMVEFGAGTGMDSFSVCTNGSKDSWCDSNADCVSNKCNFTARYSPTPGDDELGGYGHCIA